MIQGAQEDGDDDSVQFPTRPSNPDAPNQSGYFTGTEKPGGEQAGGDPSGYNSGYSSGLGGTSPRVARFKAKTGGTRRALN